MVRPGAICLALRRYVALPLRLAGVCLSPSMDLTIIRALPWSSRLYASLATGTAKYQ